MDGMITRDGDVGWNSMMVVLIDFVRWISMQQKQ